MRRSVVAVALFALVTVPWPSRAADHDSAERAVAQAFPSLSADAHRALADFLAALDDGRVVVLSLDGLTVEFRVQGGHVTFTPQSAAPSPTAPQGARSAMVVSLGRAVDPVALGAQLTRKSRPALPLGPDVLRSVGPAGSVLLVTQRGLLCALSPDPADTLVATDRLAADLGWLVSVLAEEAPQYVDLAAAPVRPQRRLYSAPPFTHKEVFCLLTSPRGVVGASLAPWAAALPATREAVLRVPDLHEVRFLAGRIRAWVVGPGSLPSIDFGGHKVIEGVEGEVGGGRGPSARSGSADIGERLGSGGERKVTSVETPYGATVAVCIEMVLPAGIAGDFPVLAGAAIATLSSQPMDRIAADWPELEPYLPSLLPSPATTPPGTGTDAPKDDPKTQPPRSGDEQPEKPPRGLR